MMRVHQVGQIVVPFVLLSGFHTFCSFKARARLAMSYIPTEFVWDCDAGMSETPDQTSYAVNHAKSTVIVLSSSSSHSF